MSAGRLLVWRGLDGWRVEAVLVRLTSHGLDARGTQIGTDPEPYRIDYELATSDGFVTRSLSVTARQGDSERRLRLIREPDGSWMANGDAVPDVAGALDCDLALSPLTNTMPVAREGILEGGAPVDFAMAWISVPDLAVHRSEQRYEPIDDCHVRYVSRDGDGFTADLELDGDGLVVRYPQLAERL